MSDQPFTEKEEEMNSIMQMTNEQLCDNTLFHMMSCVCDMCEELRKRCYSRTPVPEKPKNEVTLTIPYEWYHKNTFIELMKDRQEFIKENGNLACTCDYCSYIGICALAYDHFNINGDCLLEK